MKNNRKRLDFGREVEPDSPSYIVVTPAFNEEKNIEATLDSMIAQTAKPKVWVIVDDGSVDKTWDIITAKAVSYSWIKVLRRPKKQNPGADGLLLGACSKSFLEGLKLALDVCPNPEFVVKLDADLKFAPNYFALLLEEFIRNPRLGIAGGDLYVYQGPTPIKERASKAHVHGATKVYRRSCYEQIGGIRPVFGWDIIDEILARDAGWYVTSFDHLHLVHLRRIASRVGRFKGWARHGYMAYYVGMSPPRILIKALFHLFVIKDIVQSFGLAYGYFRHFFRHSQQLHDFKIRKLVRQHQWFTIRNYLGVRSRKA